MKKWLTIGLLVMLGCVLGGWMWAQPAEAYDSCAGGNTAGRLAVKGAGDSTYPQYCKTRVCHPLTARSVKSIWDPYGGYWQTTYSYSMQANNASMANPCPNDVESTWMTN